MDWLGEVAPLLLGRKKELVFFEIKWLDAFDLSLTSPLYNYLWYRWCKKEIKSFPFVLRCSALGETALNPATVELDSQLALKSGGYVVKWRIRWNKKVAHNAFYPQPHLNLWLQLNRNLHHPRQDPASDLPGEEPDEVARAAHCRGQPGLHLWLDAGQAHLLERAHRPSLSRSR